MTPAHGVLDRHGQAQRVHAGGMACRSGWNSCSVGSPGNQSLSTPTRLSAVPVSNITTPNSADTDLLERHSIHPFAGCVLKIRH